MDKYEERCRDCAFLVVDEHGQWLCENCLLAENIMEIHHIETCFAVEGDDLDEIHNHI